MRHRYARGRRSAVEDPITHKGITSEPGRSHVWPAAANRRGPHREGEEPKPMMHEHGKSDSAIVAPPLRASATGISLPEDHHQLVTRRHADPPHTHPPAEHRRGTNQVRQQITIREHFRRRNARSHPDCRAIPVRGASSNGRPYRNPYGLRARDRRTSCVTSHSWMARPVPMAWWCLINPAAPRPAPRRMKFCATPSRRCDYGSKMR